MTATSPDVLLGIWNGSISNHICTSKHYQMKWAWADLEKKSKTNPKMKERQETKTDSSEDTNHASFSGGHTWTLYTELPGHSLDLGVVNSWPISLPQPRFGCTLVSQTHRWIGGLLDVFSPVESNEYLSSSSPSLTSYSKSLASSLTSYTKSDHHQRNHWYHNYQFGGCSPLLIPPNNNTWLHRLQRIFVTAIITIKFDISLV